HVTGVQTCALPISRLRALADSAGWRGRPRPARRFEFSERAEKARRRSGCDAKGSCPRGGRPLLEAPGPGGRPHSCAVPVRIEDLALREPPPRAELLRRHPALSLRLRLQDLQRRPLAC